MPNSDQSAPGSAFQGFNLVTYVACGSSNSQLLFHADGTIRSNDGYSKGQCGLACGTGFVNLVGSARSADCLGDSVKTYCENQPEGFCEVKPRPWWATQPPSWVCSSKL